MRTLNLSRNLYLSLAALFGLAVFLRLLPGERTIDDAYITFRYAHNLVTGLGFVYNPGERVLGTTTPFFTLLMAGSALVFRTENYPALAVWVNALADGLTCALLPLLSYLITGRYRAGMAAGALYAIAPFSVTFAIGGMETSVFVLLLMLTAVFYLMERNVWALTAALALLTRPDALIFIGPIGLDCLIRNLMRVWQARKPSLMAQLVRPTAFFLAPTLLWTLFATAYFGSALPHSIAAKTAAYKLAATDATIRLMQHYGTPFFEQLSFPSAPVRLALIFVYFMLAVLGLWQAFRRNSRSLSINLYPFLYFATFAIANPLIFRWYLTPPLPFYFLLILSALAQMADGLYQAVARRFKLPPATALFIFALPCLAFAALSARAWVLRPDHGPQQPAPDMAWFKLEQIYTQVGTELAPEMKPGSVIAAGDIGALGYFSHATILDTLGLISPQSTSYYPLPADQLVINYAISADLIADQKPDYVVFLEVYGRRTLLTDPRFLADYTLRQKIPTDIYGSDSMLVYERVTP